MRPFRAYAIAVIASLFLSYSALVQAQDSPGRFEVGGNITGIRNANLPSSLGVGIEGDVNFGRHFALDAALNWFPSTSSAGQGLMGLFGAKAGLRTNHFGFFAKVRPGIFTIENSLRGVTFFFDRLQAVNRFARLTEPALDLGGVVEYYPARHWAIRWDAGDTVIFDEHGPTFATANPSFPSPPPFPGRNRQHFQFSTGVHYRF